MIYWESKGSLYILLLNFLEKENNMENEKEKDNVRHAQQVINTPVKTEKKSPAKKFFENFISDDINSIKEHLVNDIVIPAVKDTIVDTIENFTSMLFYGTDSKRVRGRRSGGYSERTNYNVISYKGRSEDRDYTPRMRSMIDIDDVIFNSRAEALDVLSALRDDLDKYGMVSVMNFKEMIGLKTNFTEDKYGWYDLSACKVTNYKGGWIITLPKAKELD